MELKLKQDHAQVETKLGIIDIWQIEGGELFTVEIFPPNQSDESFQKGEFTNVWNALEIAVNMDFARLRDVPQNWDWQQTRYIEQEAVTALFKLLSTIQNLEDLKEVKINEGNNLFTPVYSSVEAVRNKYNDNFCSFCGCKLDEDNSKEYSANLYCCEKCFKEFQNKLILSDIQYEKNYTIGKEYLEHVAEENNWEYIEIVEDTKEYKYGLLLIAYEDDEHEEEIDHICIDLANLDMFVPVCSQCGAFITDETWQNEYEETICEECLIQNMAKAKNLIQE